MGAFGRAGQWQEAQSIFNLMGNSGLAQDLHSYNTLIDAFCKGGQINLAERMLDNMTSEGVQPNVVSFLPFFFAVVVTASRVLILFELGQITYSSIIDGYAKAGREEDALATFSKMREVMKKNPGIHPDRYFCLFFCFLFLVTYFIFGFLLQCLLQHDVGHVWKSRQNRGSHGCQVRNGSSRTWNRPCEFPYFPHHYLCSFKDWNLFTLFLLSIGFLQCTH